MKKRTKFRLRNDLAVPFWISIFICLLGAASSFQMFYKSFFRALEKMNEEPIAIITFKYKTAQRKFLERVVWDRLRQNSPVYNGDTIHTAELSEATIWFDDGTTLELNENTMAQVFRHSDGTIAADLESGGATVDSSTGSSGVTLSSGGVQLDVKSGTKISAQKSEESESLSLTVQKGSASLSDGTTIESGKTFNVDENGSGQARLSVVSPLPNQKILYFDEGQCPVNFSWDFEGMEEEGEEKSSLMLYLSTDKDFHNVVKTVNVSELIGDSQSENNDADSEQKNLDLDLQKGVWYWKLSAGVQKDGKELFSSGKMQVIQALKPKLLAPAAGYTYQYRKMNPSVRFIWTESDTATAYNFVVSRNEDLSDPVIEQRSSSSSIIISTLDAGNYYWQITPYYTVNKTGLANPSEKGQFSIGQRGELTAPMLVTPADGEFVNKSKNLVTLSWAMEDEASAYKISVSKSENLRNPIISKETTENYINLSEEDVRALADGQYYWSVLQLDSEGNESPRSNIRSFYAVNGQIEQRTIFPPDGYTMWKALSSDVRFTWKSNLTLTQHIQFSKDKDFNEIVYETEISNNSFSGVNLDEGDFWWRICTVDGSFTNATPAKHITVVPELQAPVLLDPTVAKRAVVRPSEAYTFKWKEIEGADYYRLRIFKTDSETPVYDENFITETEFAVDMDAYDEGRYLWQIQAYSYENENCTRRSSRLGNASFNLRRIRAVTQLEPADGAEIDGWEAMENPPYLQWRSAEKFSKAEIVLSKKGDEASEPMILKQTGYKYRLPSLTAGQYEWYINAFTMDELDISSARKFSFSVKAIPPFAKPLHAVTEDGTLFNAKYLRKKPYIKFTWEPVPRAFGYIIEIFDSEDNSVVKQYIDGNETSEYVMNDLSKLSKGNFKWKVKAVRLRDDGESIFIDGIPAENAFTIDFSISKSGGRKKNNGELYAE